MLSIFIDEEFSIIQQQRFKKLILFTFRYFKLPFKNVHINILYSHRLYNDIFAYPQNSKITLGKAYGYCVKANPKIIVIAGLQLYAFQTLIHEILHFRQIIRKRKLQEIGINIGAQKSAYKILKLYHSEKINDKFL